MNYESAIFDLIRRVETLEAKVEELTPTPTPKTLYCTCNRSEDEAPYIHHADCDIYVPAAEWTTVSGPDSLTITRTPLVPNHHHAADGVWDEVV